MNDIQYIFVIKMARWGDEELHSYCSGAYTTLLKALYEGIKHSVYRDGKYEPVIYMFELDGDRSNVMCRSLEQARILYKGIHGSEWKELEDEVS